MLETSLLNQYLQPLVDLLTKGGFVVAILLVLSVLSLAITLYKIWQFKRVGVAKNKRARGLAKLWCAGNKEIALQEAENEKSLMGQCLAALMRLRLHGQLTEQQQREEIERFCMVKLDEVRLGHRAMDMIAQIAPLLGLFGTVLGMIEAFQSMASAGAQVDPAALAGGIWVALLTTAVGLAVAIPTSVLQAYFEARVEKLQLVMEDCITMLFTSAPIATGQPAQVIRAADTKIRDQKSFGLVKDAS
ncbi:MotA/TolQ/ExbB proton channel family protein [Polycladidibacter stylochi]|uniref:MotA/TolQ/ExbB proton channel family protein n=1 Tax=Polycladidibacter stylochi TaxID=1807766 RepID=UPI000835FDC6|nr:MotA/TolQ/ExbB proton channel family protein [Pseudovibrio stylochi]